MHAWVDGGVYISCASPTLLDVSDPDPWQWDLHLGATSSLVDAGTAALLDPDGTPSDVGAYGGPAAPGFDRDRDGHPEWWLPGPYDPATSPTLDRDDRDPAVHPGAGC